MTEEVKVQEVNNNLAGITLERIQAIFNIVKEEFGEMATIEFRRGGTVRVYNKTADALVAYFKRIDRYFEIDVFDKKKSVILYVGARKYRIKTVVEDVENFEYLKEFLSLVNNAFWKEDRTYEDYINFYFKALSSDRALRQYTVELIDNKLVFRNKYRKLSAEFTKELYDKRWTVDKLLSDLISAQKRTAKVERVKPLESSIAKSPFRLLAMYGFTDENVFKTSINDELRVKFVKIGSDTLVSLTYIKDGVEYKHALNVGDLLELNKEDLSIILSAVTDTNISLEKILIGLYHTAGYIKSFSENNGVYTTTDRLNITIETRDLFDSISHYMIKQ